MSERVPVPELTEDEHAHDSHHVGVAGTGLQGEGTVTTTAINNALGQDRTKLSHHVLMLVCDHFGVQIPIELHLEKAE